MEKVDVVIIGAGVVGLAIAKEIGQRNQETVVIERLASFGQEASSRNSEVIHAGLHYPESSLKAKLCVEGKGLLYQLCEEQHIPHKRLGKLIAATNASELEELEELARRGKHNGVLDLKLLTKEEVERIEPHIKAIGALHSPSTGIVDTHQLMKHLESSAKENHVVFAYNCEVVGIEKKEGGYKLCVRDVDGETTTLLASVLINSAGICSDRIAEMTGIDIEAAGYKLYYCKGEYFRVRESKAKFVNHLTYPPPKEFSLGIHTAVDLQGGLKLGPNAFYVEKIDYDVDPSHGAEFYEAVKEVLPFIELDDLSPDMAGIRPKLQAPGEAVKDFVIVEEGERGFPGLVNLIGIESPGLTASLAIAKYVGSMI